MYTQKPTGRNLITVAEAQEFIKNSDASLTSFLQSCISFVSGKFETYCNKGLKLNTYTDLYDGNATFTIHFNQYPIISISALQYKLYPESEFTDFYTGSATSNIFINDGGEVVLYSMIYPKGINNIKAVYTAGYESAPFDLKKIACEAVQTMFDNSKYGQSTLGLQNMNIGTGGFSNSVSFNKLETSWIETLEFYKKGIN